MFGNMMTCPENKGGGGRISNPVLPWLQQAPIKAHIEIQFNVYLIQKEIGREGNGENKRQSQTETETNIERQCFEIKECCDVLLTAI